MPLIRRPSPGAPPLPDSSAGDLASPSPDLRWAAARAAPDTPASVAELGEALAREADPRVREAICTALVRIGTPASAAVVLPLLRSDDAALRTAAMDIARAMPKALGAHMADLLADPDGDVRLLACELVRELDAAVAEKLLIGVIEHDAERNVCAAAIEALTEIGGPGALPALALCAQRFRDDPFIVFAVEIASGRLGAATDRG